MKIAPDLVILYAHKDGLRMAERLERADIPAIVIEPETFDSMRDTIHILAAATGRQDRAQTVIAAINGILAQVAARVADIPNDERKCVYYGTPRGFLSTAPADMLQDQIISLAGGVNSAAHLQGYLKPSLPKTLSNGPRTSSLSAAAFAREPLKCCGKMFSPACPRSRPAASMFSLPA
ncbi:MAG: ABC transporter substrate-binding protein [Desulfobacterales bacterium]